MILLCSALISFAQEGLCVNQAGSKLEVQAEVLWEEANAETDIARTIEKMRQITQECSASSFVPLSLIALGECLYLMEEYEQAWQAYKEFCEDFPENRERNKIWYWRAMSSFMQKNYPRAKEEFNQVVSLDPWAEWALQAKIKLGDIYFLEEKYAQALREYRRIPTRDVGPYLLYQSILCYEKISSKREAELLQRRLINDYPQSLEADLLMTKEEMSLPSDGKGNWTIQVGSFANEENAQTLRRHLQKKGYNAWGESVRLDGKTFHRVYVEKFSNKEKAEKKAAELAEKENLPIRILEIK